MKKLYMYYAFFENRQVHFLRIDASHLKLTANKSNLFFFFFNDN